MKQMKPAETGSINLGENETKNIIKKPLIDDTENASVVKKKKKKKKKKKSKNEKGAHLLQDEKLQKLVSSFINSTTNHNEILGIEAGYKDKLRLFKNQHNDRIFKEASSLNKEDILLLEQALQQVSVNPKVAQHLLDSVYGIGHQDFIMVGQVMRCCGAGSALASYLLSLYMYSSYLEAKTDGSGFRKYTSMLLKELRSAAGISVKEGLPQAQCWLASWLEHGNKEFGVQQDAKQAETLYRLAARQGYPLATARMTKINNDQKATATASTTTESSTPQPSTRPVSSALMEMSTFRPRRPSAETDKSSAMCRPETVYKR